MRQIQHADSISALRDIARHRLPRHVFDFIDGGADSEITLRSNREELDRIKFLPRYLVDVSKRNTSAMVLGTSISLPLIIAPTGLAALVWPQADIELAKAARAAGVPFVISTSSSVRIEDVRAGVPDAELWFQIYLYKDNSLVLSLLERARRANIESLVLTVDTPLLGHRSRDHANRFTVPLRATPKLLWQLVRCPRWTWGVLRHGVPRMQNFVDGGQSKDIVSLARLMRDNMDASVTWDRIAWLREHWKGRIIIKGLLSPDDAESAVVHGLDAVYISNHGGRQLDGATSTISMLQEIVKVVAGRTEIIIDSGIRHGGDVAKVIAMGATAAAVGRATLYGVAAGGQMGASQALSILREQYDRTLALTGCSCNADLNPKLLRFH